MTANQRIQYRIALATESGSLLARRDISAAHLATAEEELRFAAWRKSPVEDPRDLIVREDVVFDKQLSHRVAGVRLSIQVGDRNWEQFLGPETFQSAADSLNSLTAALVRSGQIDRGTKVQYWVEGHAMASTQNENATLVSQPTPLHKGGLSDYLCQAVPCGPLDESDYPVFVLESALEQAHQYSWKGRTVEAGTWLVGRLVRQIEPTAEIFGVIDTAIEACDAVGERTSLRLSTKSYRHFEQQLTLRRKRLGRAHELAMGFHHSHPFLPSTLDGKEACPSCSLRPKCELTSSFFSTDDAQFHRSVFGRATYTVEMVLGLTAREEFDLKAFCLRGGRFRERGYYRLSRLPDASR